MLYMCGMEKLYTVYKATNKIDGSVYVGVTGDALERRVGRHASTARSGSKIRFHEAIRSLGMDSFEFSEVAQCQDEGASWEIEREVIAQTKESGATMLNTLDWRRAAFFSGKKHKAESRAKISAAVAGENHPLYDHSQITFVHKEHGEVVCTRHELMARFGLGAPHISQLCNGKRKQHKGWRIQKPGETVSFDKAPSGRALAREKLALRGGVKSRRPESVKRAISESKTGPSNASYDHTQHTFVHPEHGEVTCTQNEFWKRYDLFSSRVCNLIKGNEKSVKGWRMKKAP